MEVIRALSTRYASRPEVAAIELLNEPNSSLLDINGIRQYWLDGWGTVRDHDTHTSVVIMDAFRPLWEWNGFMTKGFNNVVLDTHQYQVFSPEQLSRNIDDHIAAACDIGRQLKQSDKWTVVGEWSAALTDCTKYLNGVGRGTRWEGTFPGSWRQGSCDGRVSGSIAGLSPQERENARRFVEAQLDAYEQRSGWFFWTWKTEQGSPEWEMRDLIAQGIMPQPITSRRYPEQCRVY